MVKKIIYLGLFILVISACSYSVYTNAYPHLKRIQLMAMENKSSELNLGDVVFNNLSTAFSEDGRLRTVTQQPDCQLEGSILSFSEKIYSYDSVNNVQDYLVVITFEVIFTDLINNKVIYENKNLVLSEIYAVSDESTSRFQSKDEAIIEICDKLYKNILQNTLESW